MKNFIAMISAITLTSAAFAQTGGLPPEQAPAGDPGKFQFKKPAKSVDTAPKEPKKSMTKEDRRAARNEKRIEKVGAKPLD